MERSFGLSTVWHAHKYAHGRDLVDEMVRIGFKRCELNFTLTAQQVADVAHCVEKGMIAVDSIHNYCPIPECETAEKVNPDIPSLAARCESERRRAVFFTKQTIETAVRVGAKVVVLHSGAVAVEKRTRKLIALLKSEGARSKKFISFRADAIADRQDNAKEHFDSLCTSYAELVPFARERGIVLGVENRFYYHELPSIDETVRLMNYFDDGTLRWWYDVGHAHILEQLGFYHAHEYVVTLYPYIVGMHLHDVVDLNDHRAPGQGDLDWQYLSKYDFSRMIKVIEVHESVTAEMLQKSRMWLSAVLR